MGLIDQIFGGGPKCPNCGKSMKKSDVSFLDSDNYICKSCGIIIQKKRE